MVPTVQAVWEDPSVSAYPVVVLDRLPGTGLDALVEDLPLAELGDLFAELGSYVAAVARRRSRPGADAAATRQPSEASRRSPPSSSSSPGRRGRPHRALDRARELEPVLVHGDLHEGQLLVEPAPPARPHRHPRLADRADRPPVRGLRPRRVGNGDLARPPPRLPRAAPAGVGHVRASARGLPDDLAAVFEWHHATEHARRLLGRADLPGRARGRGGRHPRRGRERVVAPSRRWRATADYVARMTIELVPLCTAEITLGEQLVAGPAASGLRVDHPGRAAPPSRGDRLSGHAPGMPPTPTGCTISGVVGAPDVRLTFETDDGAVVFVSYRGRIDLTNGPGTSPIYTAPTFETGDERYAWLNVIQAVAKGDLQGNDLTYEIYEVR